MGGLEGRVIGTHWRATQFLTRSNDVASIPNGIVCKARLVSACIPTLAHATLAVQEAA